MTTAPIDPDALRACLSGTGTMLPSPAYTDPAVRGRHHQDPPSSGVEDGDRATDLFGRSFPRMGERTPPSRSGRGRVRTGQPHVSVLGTSRTTEERKRSQTEKCS